VAGRGRWCTATPHLSAGASARPAQARARPPMHALTGRRGRLTSLMCPPARSLQCTRAVREVELCQRDRVIENRAVYSMYTYMSTACTDVFTACTCMCVQHMYIYVYSMYLYMSTACIYVYRMYIYMCTGCAYMSTGCTYYVYSMFKYMYTACTNMRVQHVHTCLQHVHIYVYSMYMYMCTACTCI
jgi:hypothetical protein